MDTDRLDELLSPRYRIQRELGRGGMAVVYLAEDLDLGRDVALKVLLPDLAASLGGQRFLREIEIAAKLSHPNILTLHDRGEVDGTLYYTMPYVEGESLRDRLDREKQLPIDEALTIAAEVAGALAHAHEQGVVHRDIKPENILLRDGHALVSDFGIARAVTEAGGEKLTQTGITVGTVSYMSPEQGAGDREIDGRSDLYSLGCVLYEMIGGVPPFTGPSDQAILARHQLEPPPALSTIRASTPPGVEALIEQSLAKNAVDRYKTAEHMRVVLSDPKIAAVGPGARLRRTTKSRAARVGIGVAVTAAAVFGLSRLFPTGGGLEAGVVAVLPFEVADSMERPLDAVSITNLLRSNFGYLERYRAVQAAPVRQAVEDLCPTPPIERSCGSLVARELRSQYHVTGTVTPVGDDSVQIVAYLTDEMEGRSIPPISIRRSRADGYSLVRELFQELAVDSTLRRPGIETTIVARDESRSDGTNSRATLRQEMIDADIGITGADYAVAETGSVVVLPRAGLSRLVSLAPPVHLALVRPQDVVDTLDDVFLLRRLDYYRNGRDMGSYLNFITGPSRTADIEQTLVVGVHGPKEVHMIILG